jgi:RimJ/RimL family protein N-acetyltransferase
MRHDITMRGAAFYLRPVTIDDAEFIVSLRSDENLTRFLPPLTGSVEDQIRWLDSYFQKEGDFYFVICATRDDAPHGLISIYNQNTERNEAEWGRWLVRTGSLAAPESVLLLTKVGFDVLGLKRLYCRSIVDNKGVVSFHQGYGARECNRIENAFVIRGQTYQAVEHEITPDLLPGIQTFLNAKAHTVSRVLNRAQS